MTKPIKIIPYCHSLKELLMLWYERGVRDRIETRTDKEREMVRKIDETGREKENINKEI